MRIAKNIFLILCVLFISNFKSFAQEIKTRIDQSVFKINDKIKVTYEYYSYDLEIKHLELYTFDVTSGPGIKHSTTYKGGQKTDEHTVIYTFKATRLGKQRLPQLVMDKNGKTLVSEAVDIDVVADGLNVNVEESKFKEYKAGHVFYISFPGYLQTNVGDTSQSSIVYQNEENEIYGFVTYQNKQYLQLETGKEMTLNDFFKSELKKYADDKPQVQIESAKSQKKASISFMETEVSFLQAESNKKIYFFFGIAETDTTFYTVLCQAPEDKKDKYKHDFQQIFYSIKD
jgi:hypothetical protein